jgi:polyhydroxyalkanoate synthesis regulator phasin
MQTMPSSKSPSGGSRAGGTARSSTRSSAKSDTASRSSTRRAETNAGGDGLTGLAEQLVNRIIKPLGLVVLTRERIQEVLDDAAERGRVTRSDANALATELVDRGRQQTDQLITDAERLFGRGRQQIGAATIRARRSESLDLLMRSADRARRTVGSGQSLPILAYDELTATQVQSRLDGLSPAELRKVRDYERRHANRKSVLAAIDKHLTSA